MSAVRVDFRTIRLTKRVPLAISRGVSAGSSNLFVRAHYAGATGLGEMASGAATAAEGEAALRDFCARLTGFGDGDSAAPDIADMHARALAHGVPANALAALDMALWDALAKRAGLPLYQLMGLGKPTAPTSITLGICAPEVARERVPELLGGGDGGDRAPKFRALKIKLGAPAGIDADRAMFAAVVEALGDIDGGRGVALRVDANGGWNLRDAQSMMGWLAARGVEFVEQPLAAGREAELPALYKNRPLPIVVDESCRFAGDIPALAAAVDGVNLKLMKCGGITGALAIIAAARAHDLRVMVGCMSESSLAISAAAALGGALDTIDLDSHFNLAPDPCRGARLVDGVVMPAERPGHGAKIIGGFDGDDGEGDGAGDGAGDGEGDGAGEGDGDSDSATDNRGQKSC